MFDVANFLMRWLFLSNLINNANEIQMLPFNPHYSPPSSSSTPIPPQDHQQYDPQQPLHHIYKDNSNVSPYEQQQRQYQIQQQQYSKQSCSGGSSSTVSLKKALEDEWRDQCLGGITSYPPGSQRLLLMDAMRSELVQRLQLSLQTADDCLSRHEQCRRIDNINRIRIQQQRQQEEAEDGNERNYDDEGKVNTDSTSSSSNTVLDDTDDDDPVVIITKNRSSNNTTHRNNRQQRSINNEHIEKLEQRPTEDEIDDALRTVRVIRDYLPQLVSIVLKSPTAYDPNLIDPINQLRTLIIQRCVDDANWGVDLCWLLEAEVGRAWKKIFEDRQQTGRRYIVVLDAERAAVLKHIGDEKREAFDLLQEAEQATAFGHSRTTTDPNLYFQHRRHSPVPIQPPKRLPASLSLRRCSHFGDTMQFIDQMTELSLNLRHVPTIRRHAYLQEGLKQMNRKIRRRMVTHGDVSLDVDDHLGSNDWPRISDVSADMIQFSVHLPMDPKQQKHWPGGSPTSDPTDGGVVRVLNIVEDECRILASRERCPFLVRLEVAETGLRGNDSRLYASGARGLGATVGEALALSKSMGSSIDGNFRQYPNSGYYHIPSELLASDTGSHDVSIAVATEQQGNTTNAVMPRGGWQADDAMFYANNPDDVFHASPYDTVREDQYQQLHQEIQNQDGQEALQLQPHGYQDTFITTGEVLLNRVFGQRWAEKCEEIRQTSPYGNVEGWRLASFIMKAGEDIRREALVMQIIAKLNEWFADIPENDRPHMRPYTIMSVGGDAGLVECLSDAKSIDEVKKLTDNFQSLREYFERAYGPPTVHNPSPKGLTFEQAQDNFLRSLVGYSLVCYVLQIKDRHNANILLDRYGSVIHIDFGFVLGDSPKMGKVPIFSERAPFKLSPEFWDVLGGWHSSNGGLGTRFCQMFEKAFACASAHVEEIASLVEASMMTLTNNPRHANILAQGVRNRLKMRGAPGSIEQSQFILNLVATAQTSWQTSTYDWLQKSMNGYQ